jgi:hypothetical protein
VPSSLHQLWSGRAFGLSIHSEFRLPGLREGVEARTGERALDIEYVSPAPLDERQVGERVCEWRDEGGRVTLGIDQTDSGYRFLVANVGLYELSGDGRRLRCRPVPAAGWYWRRYLIGQVLPFAALLQGLEVFHASAVEIDGSAIAISGPSGLGKSTLALELHLGGAGFLTDDVLALETRDNVVLAHAGLAMTKVRRATAQGMLEVRRPVMPVAEPLPLEAFCLLRPSEDESLHLTEAVHEPRELLGATFNLVVASAERLRAQLDLCAAMAEQARLVRTAVPRTIDGRAAQQFRVQLLAARVPA